LGVIVTAHCENAEVVSQLQQKLLAEGKTGPEWHEPSRPAAVEAEGVHHLATFAGLTGAHVYVVHTSCEDALREAQAAQNRGVRMWVETVIPYLVLDKTFAERSNFEGAKYVMSPPLREKRHQEALWNALQTGLVSTVATDHAPFDFKGQKEMGRGEFTKIPNGIPSVEDRVNLLYTYGVGRGRIDLHRFVDSASTQAARLFGLFPRKGTVQPGSDADLVVYDPTYRGTISAKTQQMNVDYSGFEGVAIEGRPSIVTLRGEVQVREGKFVGKPSHGQMLKREPTHA
jgi:dihydropyrimidinase